LSLRDPTAARAVGPPCGLHDEATLRIELLDHQLRPVPGFSGIHAATVSQSGFQTPVEWESAGIPDRIRLSVRFQGERKTDIRFHAIYVR